MLITYNGLVELVAKNVVEGVAPERINAASIDVCLGSRIWIEREVRNVGCLHRNPNHVDLAAKETPALIPLDMDENGYALAPGEFILAQTREVFNLPDDVAIEFRLKSSAARAGLDNALATWGDPGWNGSTLTLELRNNLRFQSLLLRPGLKVGQIIFWRGEPVPLERSYAKLGQYNGDKNAQPSKGIR